MNLLDEKQYVACAMTKTGGGFIKVLGEALFHADFQNTVKLAAAFPEYWKEYLELGLKDGLLVPDKPPDVAPTALTPEQEAEEQHAFAGETACVAQGLYQRGVTPRTLYLNNLGNVLQTAPLTFARKFKATFPEIWDTHLKLFRAFAQGTPKAQMRAAVVANGAKDE